MPGSGIVAAYIDRGTVTTWQAGISGTDRPLDAHTLFEIGSVTKTMTATILADMVLKHEVSLTDPVQKFLPTAVHVPRRDGKAITLLNLATQHSGLPRLPDNFSPANPNDPYADYGEKQLFAFLNSYKLTRDPGAEYEYSNLGFGLLGYALARHERTSYEEVLLSHVLRPLGMSETRVSFAMGDGMRMAAGHLCDGDPASEWSFKDATAGAGAVKSDLTDMIKYLRAAMGEGALVKTMLFAQQMRDTVPPANRIGLAWQTDDHSKLIGHGGDTAGYHASVLFTADRTRGVVLLSNGPEVNDIAAHLLDPGFTVQAHDWDMHDIPASTLEQYAGRYQTQNGALKGTVSVKDGRLYVQLAGQDAVRISPSHYPDHFFNAALGASLEFVRDNGKVVGALLTQGMVVRFFRLGDDGKPLAEALRPAFPPEQQLTAAQAAQYAGTYTGQDGLPYVFTAKDGHVFAKLAEQPAYEMFQEKPDVFYYKIVDAQVTFNRNASSVVTSLVLHQLGNDTLYTKKP